MSRRWCALLFVAAGTMSIQATGALPTAYGDGPVGGSATPVSGTGVPTVTVPQSTPGLVPTVTIPKPTPTPTPKHKKKKPPHATPKQVVSNLSWIWAYLTSYCPGSAGWLSSSGLPVFYGMLANNFYPFGTRVYMPVIGITGVVEDRMAVFNTWNHFDVWSPVCYSTPTGWFRVAVVVR